MFSTLPKTSSDFLFKFILLSANAFSLDQSKILLFGKEFTGQFLLKIKHLTVSQTTNLDSSKLKEFTGDNFEFDENGRKFTKRVEKYYGKRRNCSWRAIFPFPAVISKDLYCRHVKTRAHLGKG